MTLMRTIRENKQWFMFRTKFNAVLKEKIGNPRNAKKATCDLD